MNVVYRKAERQARIMSELQQDFESDEAYVTANAVGGDSDGVDGKAQKSSKTRHVNRNKAYKPQGKTITSEQCTPKRKFISPFAFV